MTDAAPPLIRVENLSSDYDGVPVLKDISFEIVRGEVFGIMGASGSGKTTLMNHMIGLRETTEGQIFIEGENLAEARGENRIRILNRIGVAFQEGALFGSMTLIENVRMPLEEFTKLPMHAMDAICRTKLALVGLSGFEDHTPAELSGGMKKRASIARALALDPLIVFLDEPSAGLDPILLAEIDRLVLRLARDLGVTFIIVSHHVGSISAIADRMILLHPENHRIVARGTPRTLLESDAPEVHAFFHPEKT